MIKVLRSQVNDEKGQAMVEMTIVMILLLMMLFGITEFGRLFYYSLTVHNAARAGARHAVVTPLGTSQEQSNYDQVLRNFIALRIIPEDPDTTADNVRRTALADTTDAGGKITVAYTNATGASVSDRIAGGSIEIAVYYPVDIYAPIVGRFTGNPRTVTANMIMQIEQNP